MGKRINRYLTESRSENRRITVRALKAIVADLEQAGVPDHAHVVRGEGGDAYLFEWEEGQERGKRDE